MAGCGKRFSDAGYSLPKYLLKVGNRTLFELALSSLPLELGAKIIFVALKEHTRLLDLRALACDTLRKLGAPGLKNELLLLDSPTGGQALTALAARGLVAENDQLAIFNIDTYFRSRILKTDLESAGAGGSDGVIGSFKLPGRDEKWSFALTGPDGRVIKTAEKERISDNALTGFYHFSRAGDFFEAAAAAYKSGSAVKGEYYVAPLYNALIKQGRRFSLSEAELLVPLGVPAEVEAASLAWPGGLP
ncbi:MAG TPA: hypothetical protein DCL44_02705 [Elusimicrobia bacterium]|nr:hypothetical protein [Elusimicrobiota bacterium]